VDGNKAGERRGEEFSSSSSSSSGVSRFRSLDSHPRAVHSRSQEGENSHQTDVISGFILLRVSVEIFEKGKEELCSRSKKLHSRTHLTNYTIMFALSSTVATRAVRAP